MQPCQGSQWQYFSYSAEKPGEIETDNQNKTARALRSCFVLAPYFSVMMGLCNALAEEFIVQDGHVLTNWLTRCSIPGIMPTPEITFIIVEHPVEADPYGAKGVGEMCSIPTTPAITNAIYNTVGVRVDKLSVDQKFIAREIWEREELK